MSEPIEDVWEVTLTDDNGLWLDRFMYTRDKRGNLIRMWEHNYCLICCNNHEREGKAYPCSEEREQ
jgi:hypothetical protein